MPGRRTGLASLPLHGGKAPRWLFDRMVLLSREILAHIVEEYGSVEVLRRLSDPYWFQAFGCVLGFDWHSSGVTTTVCAVVKKSLRSAGAEWGLFAAGGKGAASRKSPAQIATVCESVGRDPVSTYERAPADFEALLGIHGVGPRTLRALALASELIYGMRASTRDPARFAFAHGGKDGIPYPVDRETYDKTIHVLRRAVDRAHIDRSERIRALKRLASIS